MIAVTGANGLLGSFIVRQLHENNRPFVALKRPNSDTSLLTDLADTITWRDTDILDPVSLHEAMSGVSGVIHAAAMVSFNSKESDKVMRVNVEGTRNVVDACLANGVKRLLHVSSVAALGRDKDQAVITEDNQWTDSPWNTVYSESKYKAELEVFRGHEEGLSVVIINPSVILAQANWLKSSAKIFRYIYNERPFYTNGSFNYVDARDVAGIALRLYESTENGGRFILNGGTTTIKEFFDAAATAMHKKKPGIKLSRRMLNVLAGLESCRALFTGVEPLITKETARLADSFFRYDNQKIIATLDYRFRTLDDTLSWCTGFYRKQMELKN